MNKKAERLFWPDFVRAIACICVVIVHFNASVTAMWTLDNSIMPNHFLDMYLGTIGVDLFFTISGAMLMYTYIKRGPESLIKFYKRRFATIYPMYWLAFFFATCISFFIFRQMPSDNIFWILNDIVGFSGYLYTLGLTPLAFYQLGEWFLAVIVCLYILAPLLLWVTDKYTKQAVGICLIIYVFLIKIGIHEQFVLMYVPNMLVGMALIKCKENFNFIATILSLAIMLLLYSVRDMIGLRDSVYIFLESICIYIILGYLGVYIEKSFVAAKITRWIAKYSYPIFLVHHRLIILLCLRFDLSTLGKRDIWLLFIIFLILTAILSKGLYLMYKRVELMWKNIKLGT